MTLLKRSLLPLLLIGLGLIVAIVGANIEATPKETTIRVYGQGAYTETASPGSGWPLIGVGATVFVAGCVLEALRWRLARKASEEGVSAPRPDGRAALTPVPG